MARWHKRLRIYGKSCYRKAANPKLQNDQITNKVQTSNIKSQTIFKPTPTEPGNRFGLEFWISKFEIYLGFVFWNFLAKNSKGNKVEKLNLFQEKKLRSLLQDVIRF